MEKYFQEESSPIFRALLPSLVMDTDLLFHVETSVSEESNTDITLHDNHTLFFIVFC
jgi:hypothetical protein